MKRIIKRCRRVDTIRLTCPHCLTEFETNNYLLEKEQTEPYKCVICECVECKKEFSTKLDFGVVLNVEERGQDKYLVPTKIEPTVEINSTPENEGN